MGVGVQVSSVLKLKSGTPCVEIGRAMIVQVLLSVRREHIRVEYSVSWLVAATILIFISFNRGLVLWLSVAMGISERDVLSPWTAQVADLGSMLTAARRDVIDLLQPSFAERPTRCGTLPDRRVTESTRRPSGGLTSAVAEPALGGLTGSPAGRGTMHR